MNINISSSFPRAFVLIGFLLIQGASADGQAVQPPAKHVLTHDRDVETGGLLGEGAKGLAGSMAYSLEI
jgi:hypothetical protein